MNGRNASGRAISLLNDAGPSVANTVTSRNSVKVASSQHSRSISSSSRPPSATRSVMTAPALSRSGSWSPTKANESPSPHTPRSGHAVTSPLAPYFADGQASKDGRRQDGEVAVMSLGSDLNPQALSTRLNLSVSPQPARSPALSGRPNPPAAPAKSNHSSWKPITKDFPCQLAQEFGCTETFTTSGHASRHAKKHTGEKGVACPMCPKRFARKDNMKQHLKTHENGRAAERYAHSGTDAGLVRSALSRAEQDDMQMQGGEGDAEAAAEPGLARLYSSSKISRPRSGKLAGAPLPRLKTRVTSTRRPASSIKTSSGEAPRHGGAHYQRHQPRHSASSSGNELYSSALSSPSTSMITSRGTPQLGLYASEMSMSPTASPVLVQFPPGLASPSLSASTLHGFSTGLDVLMIAAGVSRDDPPSHARYDWRGP